MPTQLTRIFVVVMALSLASGCTRGTPAGGSATDAVTLPSRDDWHRYDDPRLSVRERRAVRAATEAVLSSNYPRPNFDQAFRYSVSAVDDGWFVDVWHVQGFKDSMPQFVPGGFSTVVLDKDFKVKSIMPGA